MTSPPRSSQTLSATVQALPPAARPGAWRARITRVATFLAIAAAVVLVDQWTKALVRARLEIGETWPAGWEIIRLTHVENTGAAFGILQNASGPLMVIGLALAAGVTFVLLALPSRNRLYAIALSGVLGGAVGNLIDRVRLGAVTDFIDPTHYPAFNVADSAIVVSVGALLLLTWFSDDDAPTVPTEATAPTDAAAAPDVETRP